MDGPRGGTGGGPGPLHFQAIDLGDRVPAKWPSLCWTGHIHTGKIKAMGRLGLLLF